MEPRLRRIGVTQRAEPREGRTEDGQRHARRDEGEPDDQRQRDEQRADDRLLRLRRDEEHQRRREPQQRAIADEVQEHERR